MIGAFVGVYYLMFITFDHILPLHSFWAKWLHFTTSNSVALWSTL